MSRKLAQVNSVVPQSYMQLSSFKILVAITAAVLFSGAALTWYVLSVGAPSPSTTSQIVHTNVPNTTQTMTPPLAPDKPRPVVVQGNAHQSPQTQKLVFAKVDATSMGDMKSLYALYSKEVGISKKLNPPTSDFSIQVALTDLNNDGIPEAFVYQNLPGFCGSGGCILDIFQKKNEKWTKLLNELAGPDVSLMESSSGGYFDLVLVVNSPIEFQPSMVRYVWDGTQYNSAETFATWDGTKFTKVQ